MLNIVLFGPPGAGKGTQADKLVAKYGLLHVSTGEIIRDELKRGTPLGKKAEDQMKGGGLASDDLVISIIETFLAENSDVKGTIFDGFPRTTPQAEAFDSMLRTREMSVDMMLSLDVADDELIHRLMERGKVSGRADDADINVIKNRIDVYKKQTAVVEDFYAAQGKLYKVNGVGSIDDIFDRLCEVIDKHI